MGVRPDTRLKKVLREYYLPDGGRVSFPYLCRLLNHHSTRLKAEDLGMWYLDHARLLYDRHSKTAKRTLMRSLEAYPKPHATLKDLLPGALLHVEAEGYWGGDAYDPLDSFILGAIEQTIAEDNRPLSETRKRRSEADGAETEAIVSLDAFSPDASNQHEDPWTLAAFDGIEDADALADVTSRGGLSTQQADKLRDALERPPLTENEAQVLDQLLRGFEPDDIARQRGITRSTVYNHLSNCLSKLSATA